MAVKKISILAVLLPALCLLGVAGTGASGQDKTPEEAVKKADGATQAPGDRVTHYAFVSTGDSLKAPLQPIYWAVNKRCYEMLTEEYGYPDEAIYRFSEHGSTKGPGVDGKSTPENFKKTFSHLAAIVKPDDHLTIFLVGHGAPYQGDFIHPLCGKLKFSATELKAMIDPLPSKNITIVLNACHGGGFIAKLTGPGRVVLTCTTAQESNAAKWPEHLIEALFPHSKTPAQFPGAKIDFPDITIDANGDGRISMKEAYNAALVSGVKRYRSNLREHPQLEDNGDGVGHFGKEDVVEGDGKLAAERFLGDNGKPLNFSPAAIQKLKDLNANLKLD